jgi:phospholipid transport system substrate-binding protein
MIDAKSQMSSMTVFAARKGYADPALHFLENNPRLADPEVQLPDALIQPAMKAAGSCGEVADPIEEEGCRAMCSFRATSIHADGRPTAVMPSWRALAFAVGLGLAASSESAYAAQASSGETVQSLYDALVGTMKNGRILGESGRFTQLKPVILRSFDIASMARFSIGPTWGLLSQSQRQQMTESFGRYISAIYADRFDSYAGQKLEVRGEEPGPFGVMVKSQIIKANGEPVEIDYMMHRAGEGWLIADIYVDGAISEVATRRSEFAAILRKDGIDGLITALDRKTETLIESTTRSS